MAQLVERSAVNRQVLGSIPSGGAFLHFLLFKNLDLKIELTVVTVLLSSRGLGL